MQDPVTPNIRNCHRGRTQKFHRQNSQSSTSENFYVNLVRRLLLLHLHFLNRKFCECNSSTANVSLILKGKVHDPKQNTFKTHKGRFAISKQKPAWIYRDWGNPIFTHPDFLHAEVKAGAGSRVNLTQFILQSNPPRSRAWARLGSALPCSLGTMTAPSLNRKFGMVRVFLDLCRMQNKAKQNKTYF